MVSLPALSSSDICPVRQQTDWRLGRLKLSLLQLPCKHLYMPVLVLQVCGMPAQLMLTDCAFSSCMPALAALVAVTGSE